MSLLFSKHLTLRITELRKKLWQEQLQREIEKKNIFEQQNTTLEQLVQVRTSEIEQQKEEIETQRDALEEQNQKITKQHEDITASINAALRIQKAMLPLTNEISTVLPQHFILFRPRDIVSGDFYYFFSNQNLQNAFANENPAFEARNSWQQNILPITVLAAVDCTGHGVPGALMSMIGNELLNEIIQTKNISEANQILNYLDAGIRRTLQQEETENTDGMDIALCVIKKMTNQVIIEYAGANNPLYYVKTMQEGETSNNVFQEIKADKIPIGGKYKPEQLFTKHSIIIENNNQIITTFYLFSDGLQDQFGGEKGKKFMVKKLKEFFTSIAHLPLEEQKQITEHTLETWKKGYEQVDDILVIGFRV
jgi:serine phosphatase RsbU (regulator of sigma subunit)